MTTRPSELVTLDGKELVLTFDLNALTLFEDKMNLGIHKILGDFRNIPQMKFVKMGLWAGVQHCRAGKQLTPDRIGATLAPELIDPYMQAILKELVRALGKDPTSLDEASEDGPLDESPSPGTGTA